jgi:hypothetical protein
LNYLLNHSKDALSILQNKYKNLLELEKYTTLMKDTSLVENRPALVNAVQVTDSSELSQCTHPEMLRALLLIGSQESSLKLRDDVKLLPALLSSSSADINNVLRETIQQLAPESRAAKTILEAITVSKIPTKNLLEFFNHFQRTTQHGFSLMLKSLGRRQGDLPNNHIEFKRLLEHGRASLGKPLVSTLSNKEEILKLIQIGKHVSSYVPVFAEWFLEEELPFVPEDLNVDLLQIIQEITLKLHTSSQKKLIGTIPQKFRRICDQDWILNPPRIPKGYLLNLAYKVREIWARRAGEKLNK